ncbi:hypothetical protein GGI35DRAFT_454552 [Trichoderma velutinum]
MLLSAFRISGVIALVISLVHGSEILGPSSNCTTLDFSLLDSAPYPPHDIDIAQDHAFESYNLLGNDSWVITDRDGAHPPQWVHMSRASTIWGTDYESKRKIRRASGKDQLYLGWGFSQSNRCPYPSAEGDTHHCLRVGSGTNNGYVRYEDNAQGWLTQVFKKMECDGLIFQSSMKEKCWTNLYYLSLLPQDW